MSREIREAAERARDSLADSHAKVLDAQRRAHRDGNTSLRDKLELVRRAVIEGQTALDTIPYYEFEEDSS